MNQNNDMESFDPTQDDQLQKELDEALGDKSVEELMAEAEAAEKAAAPTPDGGEEAKADGDGQGGGQGGKPGEDVQLQLVRGRITQIREEDVFVDVTGMGTGNQGVVPLKQFDRPPRVGSIMDFIVDRVDESEGLIHLSREGAVTHATWSHLTKGDNVEVHVTGSNKGGLELALVGNIRGFMPASQIDLHHVDDMDTYIGQKLTGRVQEIDRKAKNVVVSRRAFLEVERKRSEKKVWAELEPGQVREGTVSKLMEFGAFVDIGGVDGLLHVSDMSYSRVNKPEDVVKVGDKLQVKVLKLDGDKRRISLGLKQTQPDPWESSGAQLSPGSEVEGKVVRIADFGAFVELAPGVDGLLPVSEMAWSRVRHPKDVVKEGDNIRLRVLEVNPEKHRLTLSLKGLAEDPWIGAEHKWEKHAIVDGTVVRTTEFGAFVSIVDGVEGLVHISELADRRVDVVTDVLKEGQTEKFRVLEVDEDNRKLRLSLSQVKNLKPEGDGNRRGGPRKPREKFPSEYTAKAKSKDGNLKGGMGAGGGMGSGLGDLKL